MVIGVVWEDESSAAYYRAIDLMGVLERRGHEIVWPANDQGRPELERLVRCDVVHDYRRADDRTRDALRRLAARGVAIVYDNDDDVSKLPRESPDYKQLGGMKAQRAHLETVKTARLAHLFTTTNELLAERYRRQGVERTEVIGNYVASKPRRKRSKHRGIVIGWIAGGEHYADAKRLKLAGVLQGLVAAHPDLYVECIGVDLALPERYRHDSFVPFRKLPERIGGFDIGIAPLADIPLNQTRSDIKVKEYAACGVPWLASPIAPYLGLGEQQGGRLVADADWHEALDELVTSKRERKQLGRRAKSWAKGQRIETAAGRWESIFEGVVATMARPALSIPR